VIRIGERRVFGIKKYLSMYLPKIWVDNTGLKKGDTVLISMDDDGSLFIRPCTRGDANES